MKKTCGNCWNGGRGKKYFYGSMIQCQKLRTAVNANKDRSGCKSWSDKPPIERPHLGYFGVGMRW